MLQPQIPLMAAPVPKHSSNLGDLKSQIFKRLGQEQAQQYFNYLNRFLLQNLSKREFNKLCILTLVHENIPLHNQLIRLIFHNAYHAKERGYENFPQILVLKQSTRVDDRLVFCKIQMQSGKLHLIVICCGNCCTSSVMGLRISGSKITPVTLDKMGWRESRKSLFSVRMVIQRD